MNEAKRQLLAEIETIAREIARGLNLEIVEFVVHGQGRHSLLRIDIDRAGMPGVGLADCEALSRSLDARIEALPLFGTAYELQVSSPGIDRPIRTDDDLRRNTGRPVWLEFEEADGNIRELRGILAGAHEDGTVTVDSGGTPVRIPRDRIVFMKQDVALGGGKRKRP